MSPTIIGTTMTLRGRCAARPRAREKISWTNMEKKGSEAPLLFHGWIQNNVDLLRLLLISRQSLLLDPRALRFFGSNKFVQLVFSRAPSGSTTQKWMEP